MKLPPLYARVTRARGSQYLYTPSEIESAAWTIGAAFLVALATIVVTGVASLAAAPRADIDYADLGEDATCLRAGRRADATVVYLDVGAMLNQDVPYTNN